MDGRRLSWDWYAGTIPENVVFDDTAFIETSFSFHCYRSEAPVGVALGRGASTYLGTMFDVGRRGRVSIGDYALVHGARIVCDAAVDIGAYALISWNVVIMDSYRLARDVTIRRRELEAVPFRAGRYLQPQCEPLPIHIGTNVWIGFDACILPGVTIGEGAIVGARSVVRDDIPPYTIVAGNPARVVREIESV
jgi:carbonic anhydrase/acetyltransferase-like protein (isoleucine patch superfamily)